MVNDLAKPYNTLKLIETKSDNTIYMADCLRFIEPLMTKVKTEKVEVSNDRT